MSKVVNALILQLTVVTYGFNALSQTLPPQAAPNAVQAPVASEVSGSNQVDPSVRNKTGLALARASIQINLDQNSYIDSININGDTNTTNNTTNNNSNNGSNNTTDSNNRGDTSTTNNTTTNNTTDNSKNYTNETTNNNTNSTSTTTNKIEDSVKSVDIKDVVDSTITTDASETEANVTNTAEEIKNVENEAAAVAPIVAPEVVKEVPKEEIKKDVKPEDDKEVVVETPVDGLDPKDPTPSDDFETPVVDDSKKPDDNVEDPNHEVVAEDKKEVTPEEDSSRFSARGMFGFGKFTTIDDIKTSFAFGFAVGYRFKPRYTVEFQYLRSEFEDTYNYNYYTTYNISGYKLFQNDMGVILNYNLVPRHDYNIYLRGGFNIITRSAHNDFTGETNKSNAFGSVFGIGADYKIGKNLAIAGQVDYNLSLSSSGYNHVSSPLFLVNDENFMNINVGLKYKF